MKYRRLEHKSRKGRASRLHPRFLVGTIAAFAILLVVVSMMVIGDTANDEPSPDYDLYFGMTILSGWPIESILPPEPSLMGYIFSHWSDTPGGSAFDFSRPITQELTFYAYWEREDGRYLEAHHYDDEYLGGYNQYWHYYHDHGDSYYYQNDYNYYSDYHAEYYDNYHNEYTQYVDYQVGDVPVFSYQDDYYLGEYYQDGYSPAPYYQGEFYPYNYYPHNYEETTYTQIEGYNEDNHYHDYGHNAAYYTEVAPGDKIFVRFEWNHNNHMEIRAAAQERIIAAHEEYLEQAYAATRANAGIMPLGGITPFGGEVSDISFNEAEVEYVAAIPANYVGIMPLGATVTDYDGLRHAVGNAPWGAAAVTPFVITLGAGWGTVTTSNHPAIGLALDQWIHVIGAPGTSPVWNQNTGAPPTLPPLPTGINFGDTTGMIWTRHFVVQQGARLILENVTLNSTNSGTNHDALFMPIHGGFTTSPVAPADLPLTSGTSVVSGGITIFTNSTVTLNTGAIISGNNGTTIGGGGVDIMSETQEAAGGRLYMHAGAIIRNNFTPRINSAPGQQGQTGFNGGGVRILSGATFTMHGGHIYGNTGDVSGGVHVARVNGDSPAGFCGSNTGQASTFTRAAPIFIIHSGTIGGPLPHHQNWARAWGGGVGININQGASFSFDIATGNISGNSAAMGGGVDVTGGAPIVCNNVFGTCIAPCVTPNIPRIATVNLTRVTNMYLINNEARSGHGGGINISTSGQVFVSGNAELIVEDNVAAFAGGGMSVSGYVNIDNTAMGDVLIRDNEAGTTGGGVNIASSAAMTGELNILGSGDFDVIDNTAGGAGGGISVIGNMTMGGSGDFVIYDNSAGGSGGGINIVGALTMSGTGDITITDNDTGLLNSHHGGGINHGGTGVFSFTTTGTVFIARNTAGGNGGGISRTSTDMGAVTFGPSVTIRDNTAGVAGGGIHLAGGTYNFSGVAIVGNRVASSATGPTVNDGGGGVSMAGGVINMVSGNIGSYNHDNNSNRAMRGAGVRIAGGIFNMNGGMIQYNVATHIAHGLPGSGEHILGSRGGAVFVSGTGTFNMRGNVAGTPTVIQNSRATYGGGVYVLGGNFNMHGTGPSAVLIHLNRATNGGGVAMGGTGAAGAGGTFTMHGDGASNRSIQNNEATNGGGVFIGGAGTFAASGPQGINSIRDNLAFDQGGGVDIAANGHLHMNSPVFHIYNNRAADAAMGGGGINVRGTGTTLAPNLLISQGTVGGITNRGHHGSGVRMTSGFARMDGGYIVNNIATSVVGSTTPIGLGGGVFVTGGAAFEMVAGSGTIANNQAVRGGGVHVTGGTNLNFANPNPSRLLMEGGFIGTERLTGNTATTYGGGVYVTAGGWINVAGGAIRGNTALHGGGVYVHGTSAMVNQGTRPSIFTMSGGYVGGPDALLHFNDATSTTNPSGGGVRVLGNARFSMSGGRVQFNRAVLANGRGAGVSVGGAVPAAIAPAMIEIDGFDYINEVPLEEMNEAPSYMYGQEHGDYGIEPSGGIGIVPFSATPPPIPANILTMTGNSEIVDNEAHHLGGGVHLSGGATFLMNSNNALIARNRVNLTGGDNQSTPASWGGGVAMNDAGTTFTLQAGRISENRAEGGGGVSVRDSAQLAMPAAGSGDIYNNTATIASLPGQTGAGRRGGGHGGGGVEVITNGTFNMSSGFVRGNRSYNSAGGVNINGANAVLNMHGGSIRNNYTIAPNEITSGNGGGVHLTSNANFHMHGGEIAYNRSTRYGGGVHVFHSTMNMPVGGSGIIRNNTATRAGGGINAASWDIATTLNMHSGTIENNGLHGGVTTRDGGGVAVLQGAVFNMSNGVIRGNQAFRGGGVFIGEYRTLNRPVSQFNMTGGSIGQQGLVNANVALGPGTSTHTFENDATYTFINGSGGGLYVGRRATATLSNGSIVGNRAYATGSGTVDGGGGGVYIVSYISSGIVMTNLTATNMTVTNNTAVNGMGGGIFSEAHEYADPLTRLTANNTLAYRPITLNAVTWGNNQAISVQHPPGNANLLPNMPGLFTGMSGGAAPYTAHPLNNYDINFSAPDTTTFQFIKTDWALYQDPRIINGLVGAQFRLYRQNPLNLSEWNYVSTSTSAPGGMVTFVLTRTGEYRIVESVVPAVPPNLALPPAGHYWRIHLNASGMAVVDVLPSNSEDYRIPHFVLHNGNWYVGNFQRYLFEFYKTDHYLYNLQPGQSPMDILLEGAIFRLFRTILPTLDVSPPLGTGSAGLVAFDSSGNLVVSSPWVEVPLTVNTSSLTVPISYSMDPRFTYQLVEVLAPPGFQIPFGQWRINVDQNGVFGAENIGGFGMPVFVGNITGYSYWFVGNWPDLELPLTGARITSAWFATAGTSMIVLAMGIMIVMIIGKRKRAGIA